MTSYSPLQLTDNAATTQEAEWEKYARLSCCCSKIHPVPQDVLKLSKDGKGATGHLNLTNVSGPAVKGICFALPLLFLFVMVFPYIVWRSSTCPPKGEVYGDQPPWVPLLYVPVFFLVTVMELRCLRYVILPYVHRLAPFKVGFQTVSLQTWLIFHVCTSSIAKLDVFTSSVFVAKVFKGYTCDGRFWEGARQAWPHVIKESIMAPFPWMTNIVLLCLVGWAMIVLQLVVAFFMSYPSKGHCNIDYKLKSTDQVEEGYDTLWTCLRRRVWGEEKVWNADVLKVLAITTRALSIVELSCQWQMARVCEQLKTCATDIEEQEHRQEQSEQRQCRCFEMLEKEARICVFRLWYINIFEKAVILETQVTMYALHVAMGHGHDYWAISSICISLLTSLHTVVVACKQLWSLRDMHKKAVNQLNGLMQQQQDQEDGEKMFGRCMNRLMGLAPEGCLRGKVLSAARSSKMYINLRMGLGICALLIILIHVLVKFIMAARGCPRGFWNIPTDISSLYAHGCVDMSGILDTIKSTE